MINKRLKIPIYFVSLALILIFCFSWIFYSAEPIEIVKYLLAQAGAGVGMSISVPENPFNTLAQQLQEKEAGLEKREEAVAEVLEKSERDGKIILTLILSLTTVLFFLILLNFYLDYQSRKYQKV